MAPHGTSTALRHITNAFHSTIATAAQGSRNDDPNYYSKTPQKLITTSTVHTFETGTGDVLFQSLRPLLQSTDSELIIVTCFWASSSSLQTLSEILTDLSNKALSSQNQKIKVRICFSSSSPTQKLFHNQTTNGQGYPSDYWVKRLNLPTPHTLRGLDLQIKSVFLLPFSVMHPKFILVDRKFIALPSCNVSHEEWFEGCITFSGRGIMTEFLRFYLSFWERQADPHDSINTPDQLMDPRLDSDSLDKSGPSNHGCGNVSVSYLDSTVDSEITDVPTIFLPSPHHRWPSPQFLTPQDQVQAPHTPLNDFLLKLFSVARTRIRIQTPNLTSPPVLAALLAAIVRGVDVTIVTSENLMTFEQLATAGTTTRRCLKKLARRWGKIWQSSSEYDYHADVEAALPKPTKGNLRISYFQPIIGPNEPQKSHLKMTIVDNNTIVLGSGNLDRASWFTSQELGVAFFDTKLVDSIESAVDLAMENRERVIFDGHGSSQPNGNPPIRGKF